MQRLESFVLRWRACLGVRWSPSWKNEWSQAGTLVWPRSGQQTRPEGELMQSCSTPSGGVDPVQQPSPAAEAWGEACSKGRSQVDD
jgi:hypothetical protein